MKIATGDFAVSGAPTKSRQTLYVTRNLSIPLEELEWRFTTSGGPGGQHANRSSTRAEVRFAVERSAVLGPRQRTKLLERFGATVRASSSDHRSQTRNREVALRRLAERISDALRTERPRLPTAPSAAQRSRRLEAKRRRSTLKKDRTTPGSGEGF
jgi:ribosome-associated protein